MAMMAPTGFSETTVLVVVCAMMRPAASSSSRRTTDSDAVRMASLSRQMRSASAVARTEMLVA